MQNVQKRYFHMSGEVLPNVGETGDVFKLSETPIFQNFSLLNNCRYLTRFRATCCTCICYEPTLPTCKLVILAVRAETVLIQVKLGKLGDKL